jgi:hypothetical protein
VNHGEVTVRLICPIMAAACLLVMPRVSPALTGLGFGVRAGVVSQYDNPEIVVEDAIRATADNMSMVGVHIRLSRLSIFTLEFVADRSWWNEKYELRESRLSAEVEDIMLAINLKYVIRTPLLRPYLGGGMARHQIIYNFGPAPIVEDIGLVIPDDGARWGVHAIIGVTLQSKTSPIEPFIEGRLGTISDENGSTEYSAIYGGITFKLL